MLHRGELLISAAVQEQSGIVLGQLMHRVQEWLPVCTPYFDMAANFRAKEPWPGTSQESAVLCRPTELLPAVFGGRGTRSPPL